MKVLILSCKTGGGHDAAGLAMKEALEAKGHEAILLDYLTLAGQKVSQTVGDVYVNTVKTAPHGNQQDNEEISCLLCQCQNGKIFAEIFGRRKI